MYNREGFYVTDTVRECTKCHVHFERTNKTVALCGPCNSSRVKEGRDVREQLWRRARDRCKASGREFLIEIEDIIIPDVCPYLKIPLVPYKGRPGGRPNSPSLDRIDNEKGYTKDNIQVISHLANQMKANATHEQLVMFARSILALN